MYKKIERDSGIELLRIVLMFMIILHHLIGQGLNLQFIGTPQFKNSVQAPCLLFIDNILIIAVNCFFFISGYYGIKFRSLNLLSLIFQGIFYALAIDIIFSMFFSVPLAFHQVIKDFFSVFTGEWWFLTCYFFLYLIAPFLNAGLKGLNNTQYKYILVVMFVLNSRIGSLPGTVYGPLVGVSSGYSLFSFAFIYLLGRYIYLHLAQDHILIKRPYIILMASLLLNFVFVMLVYVYRPAKMYGTVLGYSNPIIVLSAICFFFLFKNLKFKSIFVNSISTCVLGVYLIHVHPLIAINFNGKITSLFGFTINSVAALYLAPISFAVLSVCIFIEKIRSVIFAPTINFFHSKLKLHQLDEALQGI